MDTLINNKILDSEDYFHPKENQIGPIFRKLFRFLMWNTTPIQYTLCIGDSYINTNNEIKVAII